MLDDIPESLIWFEIMLRLTRKVRMISFEFLQQFFCMRVVNGFPQRSTFIRNVRNIVFSKLSVGTEIQKLSSSGLIAYYLDGSGVPLNCTWTSGSNASVNADIALIVYEYFNTGKVD
jgi:hypothetical protein